MKQADLEFSVQSANARQSSPSPDQQNEIKAQLIERGILAPALSLFREQSGKQPRPDLETIAMELHDLGGIFKQFARYLGTRVDLFKLEDCISFFGAQSQDGSRHGTESTHEKSAAASDGGRHYRAIKPPLFSADEYKYLSMLKRAIETHLPNCYSLARLIQDFRCTVESKGDSKVSAELFESLSLDANSSSCLFPPNVIFDDASDTAIFIEEPSGLRLESFLKVARKQEDPFFDGMEPTSGYLPEEIARVVCNAWLHLVFNCGLALVDFDENDVIIASSNQVSFVGGTLVALSRATRNNLRKYLIHSCNDDPSKALQHLLGECDTTGCHEIEGLPRLFRQLVSFRHGGWNDAGTVNSSAENVFAQVRLLGEQEVCLNANSCDFFRGLFCMTRLIRQLSPIRDSLNEGIKDIRLQLLLESTREMLDPIHWTAQTDKMLGLMMFAPKNFDQSVQRLCGESELDTRKNDEFYAPQNDRLLLAAIVLLCLYYFLSVSINIAGQIGRYLLSW